MVVTVNFDTRDRVTEINTRAAEAQLRMLEIQLRNYYFQHHHLPDRLDIFDQSDIIDNRGEQFIYQQTEHQVVLIYRGSDGIPYTADDVSHEFTIP